MNKLYHHNQIQNHLDRRLVDFFCEVNKENNWVDVSTLASWVFETNAPSEYQLSYTARKLRNITGLRFTSAARLSFLDQKKQERNNRICYSYRLISPGFIESSKEAHTFNREMACAED